MRVVRCVIEREGQRLDPCRGATLGPALVRESPCAQRSHREAFPRPVVGNAQIGMAADAVPVCLCGGSADMIPPAEEHLPANLCPLIKSTYGYHLQKANPFLEMADLIVAETTCDGKKKMYELMGKTREMYVLELPQKPSDSDAMAHWVSELRKLKAKLEECFDVEITDEKIQNAIKTMNRERALRRELAALMMSPYPPLTGRQLLDFKSNVSVFVIRVVFARLGKQPQSVVFRHFIAVSSKAL